MRTLREKGGHFRGAYINVCTSVWETLLKRPCL